MDENIKKATRQSYGEALLELGKENKNIVVFDADLSTATKTNIFAKEFPERFYDMGIAEQNMISTAAGMSTNGTQTTTSHHFCLPVRFLTSSIKALPSAGVLFIFQLPAIIVLRYFLFIARTPFSLSMLKILLT